MKPLEINARFTPLLAFNEQMDPSSLGHFTQAIRCEVAEWIRQGPSRIQPAVQIDCAIGPPQCRVFHVTLADEQARQRQPELTMRLEQLPIPRVCGLVAFSLFLNWESQQHPAASYDWVCPPFGETLAGSDFDDEVAVKCQLYLLLSRLDPEYPSPLQSVAPPPWYRRLWHVVTGKPFAPGYLLGKSQTWELQEPLPYQPAADWIDQQQFAQANELSLENLQQEVGDASAASCPLTKVYALALRLHEQEMISTALQHLATCLGQHPDAPQLHYLRAEWSLQNSELEAGLQASEKTIELAPDWAAGYFVRAHVYMALEAWEQAESDFVNAAERHETKVDPWLRLAQVRAHRQQLLPAVEALDKALQCDPYHAEALAMRIDLLPYAQRNAEFEQVEQRIDTDLKIAMKYVPPHPFFLTRRAEQLLQQGRSEETVKYCTRALSLDQNAAAAFGLRGAAHLSLGEIDQAFNDITRSIELGHLSPAALETRGRIYLHRGEPELARLDCEQAITISCEFVQSYLTLANSLAALDRHDEALEALETAAKIAPHWDAPARMLGGYHMLQGDYVRAYQCFCQAIECDPQAAVNWLQRGGCQAERRNIEKALFDFEKAIELDQDLAPAYRAKAAINLGRQEIDSAIDDLTEVLRLEPDDVASRFQRAQCYLHQKKPREAREDFDRVIELAPTLAAAYSGRGQAWIELGNESRAAADFREAAKQDPLRAEDLEITRLLAVASRLQREESYPAALQKIDEALQLNGDSQEALALRAACYWHDEQFVEAVDDLTRLLDELSEDDEADQYKRMACLNNRGQVYVEMGEFQQGLADLHEAVAIAEALNNRQCQAYSLSGRALAFAGLDQLDEARADFDRSVEHRPENAWVYYNQGLVYDKLDRPKDAALCFELALSLDEPPLTPRKRQRAKAYVGKHSQET